MSTEASEAVDRERYQRGATVFTRVFRDFLGWFIHLLEYEPDIYLVSYKAERFCGNFPTVVSSLMEKLEICECELRSDVFPSAWHGQRVTAIVDNLGPFGERITEWRLNEGDLLRKGRGGKWYWSRP